MVALSVLDLCPLIEGETVTSAFQHSLALAQAAERLGYRRFWVGEHHNMAGTASSATAVIIGHIAAGTTSIHVGSGGVMLPNHAPYVIAEQFGTLGAMYPGRIDLGVGRSPGTDAPTLLQALRRDPRGTEHFPHDVQELQFFLGAGGPDQPIRAIPAEGSNVPLWILGSSLFSAQLSAALGVPFVFASHVTPNGLMQALEVYRSRFKPSKQLAKPYVMPCINAFAADTDAEAQRHFSSLQMGLVSFFRGSIGRVQPPVDDIEAVWNPQEKQMIERMNTFTIVGSPDTVRAKLRDFVAATKADEVMVSGNFYERPARIRSLEIISEAGAGL
jgi:luciferase family oxidoreductase group 1